MSKIKIKQIFSEGQPLGAVLTTDGNGNNSWVVTEAADGSNVLLGAAEDGSYTDPRYTGGKVPAAPLQPTTKVSTAIDSINEILGLLLPTAPAALSSGVLTLATPNGNAKAAQGYTANSLSNAPAAGSTVARTTAAVSTTNVLEDLGDGTDGTVSLFVNDAAVSGESLSFSGNPGDAKTTGVLRITDNKWGGFAVGGGPAPDGFFQTFDSQVVGATSPVGLNHVQIKHSLSGDTNVLTFVRDTLTAVPAVTASTVAENTPTLAASSGINHYFTGSTLNVSSDFTNLAGQTYASGTIVALSGPGTTVNFAAGQGGIPAIPAVNTLAYSIVNQVFTIGGNVFSKTAKITTTATNPNGSGSGTHSKNLLVLSGTQTFKDSGITAFGADLGAKRVLAANTNGDTPVVSFVTANSASNAGTWSTVQDLSATGYKSEAALVGGSLTADKTNYADNTVYAPTTVDYSTKDTVQYATYRFNVAAKSSFTLNVTGTYSGVWVALPGISTDSAQSPAALNGAWWDAKTLYNGAGVPGRAGDTGAGCANGVAATGTSGAVAITFGTASSSNTTNNAVFVRIRLNAGDAITALSIS